MMNTDRGLRAELSTPSAHEILTERVFDAPRELVWAAFTERELIPRWWGLRSTTTVVDQLDVEVGGAWRFVERSDDGAENGFRGVYREVSIPERLVYTFEWEGQPGHVIVNIATLETLASERTRVTVRSLFHTPEERDAMLQSMEKGLNEGYEMLDELLTELEAGND